MCVEQAGLLLLALAWLPNIGCDRPATHAEQKTSQVEAAMASTSTSPQPTPAPGKRVDVLQAGKPSSTPAPGKRVDVLQAGKPSPPPMKSSEGRVVEATFDDILFEMEKTEPFVPSMLTPQVEQWFGRRIRIRGYIYPTLRKRGLKQFVLVRDNLECCFGPGAALYDCILVHMVEGETAEYTLRPVAVEGTFRFDPLLGPDGQPMAIYHLDGEKVE